MLDPYKWSKDDFCLPSVLSACRWVTQKEFLEYVMISIS